MADVSSTIVARVDLNQTITKTILRDLFVTEDKNAHVFRIEITRGGEPVDLTGASVSGWLMRYSDRISVPMEDGKIEKSNVAVITMSKDCYAKKTMFSVTIGVSLDGVDHAVFVGEGQMTANRTDTILDPSGIIPSVEDIVAQYATMQAVTAETQQAAQSANAAASAADRAAASANTSAGKANAAASGANTAADRAGAAAGAIEGMTVTSEDVGADTPASASVSDVEGVKNIHFRLRQGIRGVTGATPNIRFEGATGQPGTDVEVSQSGTAENPVVHLTIPRGAPGEGSVSSVNGILPGPDGDVDLGDIGGGDVQTVNGIAPDEETGNITLNAKDVGALAANGTAVDSNKLGGVEAAKYAFKTPNNYAYDGVELSTVFASAAELHAAVAAGDFSKIRVGDCWTVMITGTYKDYGDNTTKSLNNAVIKYEVGGIGTYAGYGDTEVPINHLILCPRDALPNTTKWRTENTTWTDPNATNPMLGSAIYATLNASDGLLPLIKGTDIGAYMYTGPNGKGMCWLAETKASTASDATGWAWVDRGCLFLPSEREVWGQDVWSEYQYGGGLALQWPIFAGTRRHIRKGLGNGGSRCTWWCCDSMAGSPTYACYVGYAGNPIGTAASNARAVVPCFLFV